MMKNKLSQQQPPPSSTNGVAEIIDDPWEDNPSTNAVELKTEGWQASVDIHPLIFGEERPDRVALPKAETIKISPIQVLLEDGLKIKAYDSGTLKEHLKEALGLLSWILKLPPEYAS